MRILVKKGAILLAGSLLMVGSLWGSEDSKKPITLTLHTFLSSNAPPTVQLLMPWAKEVEKLSNGRLKIDLYPSMSMGGKPNELYSQAKDGVADIVYTVAGYTPGVFTRIEAFELPEIHTNSSLKTALAIKQNFNLLKDDFKKVKPLLVALAGPYQLDTTVKKVTKLEDLQGMKLRSPSRTGGWYIEELGAEPVGMPLPAVAQAFSKNAIDGAMLPMEVFPAFKFQDLTKYTTEIKGGGGFGGSVLLLLMNKDRYNKLPKDLQKVLDETTAIPLIKRFSSFAKKFETIGKNLQKKSGGEVITLSDEETKKFKDVAHKVTLRWIKDVNKKGIDGQKIIDAVKKSMAGE